MKNFLKKYTPSFLFEPLIVCGRFIKRQERTLGRYLNYGDKPFFKEIHQLGISFWILLMPTKNGCVDEIIAKTGSWETDLDLQLKKNIKKDDVFVDIGANIGYHTLFVASYLENTGKVYAFEPIKNLNEQIRKSIDRNRFTNVQLFDIGLGEEETSELIHVRKENMGESSIGAYNGLGLADTSSTEVITIKRLDSIIGESITVNTIKIDVEGYELEALKGASNILTRNHPIIFMEFSPMFYEFARAGKSKELITYLESFGYKFYTLGEKQIDLKDWANTNSNNHMAQIDIICKID